MTSVLPPDTRVPQFFDTPDRFARFYADYLVAVPDEVQRLGSKRVYLVVSTTLNNKTDKIKKLEDVLGDKFVGKRVGVKPHTSWDEILDLVAQLHKTKADCVVTVGGSSCSDAAKAALIAHSSLSPDNLTVDAMQTLVAPTDSDGMAVVPPTVTPPTLGLILVPTTLSAAEYNDAAGASNPITRKKDHFVHPFCRASCIILDPELATLTPHRLWLGSGVRAIDHCSEAMCSERVIPEVEETAEQGLRHLIPGLLACKADPGDVRARGACQVGAWKAMEALHRRIPFGASHAIGHQLGSVGGVAHGETSCILLPCVMKYNKSVNGARQEKEMKILWEVAGGYFTSQGLERGTADNGDLIRMVVRGLGLPTRLGDVGVTDEGRLERIAEHTLTDIWGKTNPRELHSPAQVREILAMAL